jgi:hypothetical protein
MEIYTYGISDDCNATAIESKTTFVTSNVSAAPYFGIQVSNSEKILLITVQRYVHILIMSMTLVLKHFCFFGISVRFAFFSDLHL